MLKLAFSALSYKYNSQYMNQNYEKHPATAKDRLQWEVTDWLSKGIIVGNHPGWRGWRTSARELQGGVNTNTDSGRTARGYTINRWRGDEAVQLNLYFDDTNSLYKLQAEKSEIENSQYKTIEKTETGLYVTGQIAGHLVLQTLMAATSKVAEESSSYNAT